MKTLYALLAGLLLLGPACQVEPDDDGPRGERLVVVDDAGREVVLPAPARRVVACAPDAAEVVYALAPEALVGRTHRADHPPPVAALPVVGDFSSPDAERVAALAPDLVVLSGMEQEHLLPRLEALGLTAYVHFPPDLDTLAETYARLGLLLDAAERATELRDELDEARRRLRARRPAVPPRVYLEVSPAPLMAACAGSLQHALLVEAGCLNVFAELPREYHRVEPEQVLRADPELVLIFCGGLDVDEVRRRAGWEGLSAVRDGHVYVLDPDIFTRAGPRIVEALDILSTILDERP